MTKSRQEAGRIAAKYVIEKLQERNYKVVETNNMALSVLSPNGELFTLKVTSLSRRNAWIIPSTKDQGSYFVLVLKPDKEAPAFFVLNPDEMLKEKDHHITSMKKPVTQYSNPELEKKGLSFEQPFPYENKWNSLPK